MDLAHRLYLGARNSGSRRFSPQDLAAVETTLDAVFHGWTTVKGVGRWRGETEETLVITFTTRSIKPAAETNAVALENCVRRLKELLGQEAVLLEQGGPVGVL